MKNIPAETFTYSNIPMPISLETYDKARKQLTEYVSKRRGVVSLYEFGSVNYPGISDLDFCVVITNKPGTDIVDFLKVKRFGKLIQNLMNMGTLMIMQEKDLARIRIWDDVKLVHRYGKIIPFIEPPKDMCKYLDICRLIDWIPERIARLLTVVVSKKISIRLLLGRLNSLSHSFNIMNRVIKKKTNTGLVEFTKEINSLRSEWFINLEKSKKRLIECLEKGLICGFESLRMIDEFIKENSLYCMRELPNSGELYLGKHILFKFSGEDMGTLLDKSCKLSKEDLSVVVLPQIFYQHFAAYSLSGGSIGEQLIKNLYPNPNKKYLKEIHPALRNVLNKRMDLCNSMAEFLANLGFKQGLFKFGWFYKDVLKRYTDKIAME